MRGEIEDMSWPTPPPPRQIPVTHEFRYPRVVPIETPVSRRRRELLLRYAAANARSPR